MDTIIHLELFIEHSREGSYFTLPFTMPPDCARMTISYDYTHFRYAMDGEGASGFTARTELNIVDLGLIAPGGRQVGVSGANKSEISLSATRATPGYQPCELVAGEWQILVGAFYIAPEGVRVKYTITCEPKSPRWLRGDLHVHTLASDGILTMEEIGRHAVRHGLDFIAITDHNYVNSRDALPHIEGLTFIPGLEWTHYRGHANFLGLDQPYDQPFYSNTPEEALAHFETAQRRGALITINHPFEPEMEFKFDLNVFPYDCLEVWNGPMREANVRAMGWWQNMLAAGKRAAICGGSDYHRDSPFQILGGPTNSVCAMSASPSDILEAVRAGHAYIVYAPNGPILEFSADGALMGDTVDWAHTRELLVAVKGLQAGDVIRVVTGKGSETILQAAAGGSFKSGYTMTEPGMARVEVLREFIPGLPPLPAIISNPIYFQG